MWPVRCWCDICIRASGKEDLHRRLYRNDKLTPDCTCDYAFLRIEHDEDDQITLFILKECCSKSLHNVFVRPKVHNVVWLLMSCSMLCKNGAIKIVLYNTDVTKNLLD